MALDYSAAWGDPMKAMTEGNAYVNSLFDRATKVGDDNAKTQAGQAFGRGDYTGAATTLANTGDISGAATVQDYALKQFQARHALLQQAVPVLSGILAKGGPKAVSDAFEQIAPTLQQSGLDAPSIDRVRQGLATNPEQMLQVLGIGAKKNLQYKQDANGQWLVIDGDTGSVVQTLGSAKPVEPKLQGFDPKQDVYSIGGGATPAAAGGLTPALPGAAPAAPAAGAGSPPVSPTGTDAAAAVPPGYAARVATNESGGNPGAQNPLSSATGNGQFISSTWLNLIRQSHPELAGMSDSALLALRNNPALSNDMIEQYAAINGKALNQAGLPVNAATLYLAHGFGSQGAITLLKSDPNAPVSSVMPGNVIAANPYLQKMTIGQLLQRFASKMGGPSVAPAAAAPTSTPAAAPSLPPGVSLIHKGEATGTLSPEAADLLAERVLSGDKTALSGLGYGSAGAQNRAIVQNLVAAKASERGMPGQRVAELMATFGKAAGGFSTGVQGNTTRAISVALDHLGTLGTLATALQNGDTKAVNSLKQTFNDQFGRPAPTNFDAARQIVADEIVKAIVGTGGAQADRDKAVQTISRASSPAQLAGVIQTYQKLLAGQLRGLKQQYEQTTGLPDFEDKLSPAAKSLLNPAPSKVIRYDAQGNRLP